MSSEELIRFPRPPLNPSLHTFLTKAHAYQRLSTTEVTTSDDGEELQNEYYSESNCDLFSKLLEPRNRTFSILSALTVVLILFLMIRNTEEVKVYTKMEETTSSSDVRIETKTFGVPTGDVRKLLEPYLKSINTSEAYPDDVNAVKPHHIRVIGAMGDSLTIGARAENFIEKFTQRYPGNSFFTGIDWNIDEHLTIYNVFRVISQTTGHKLFGGSTGGNYDEQNGFNVAVGAAKSTDMLRQAKDLVARILANSEIDIASDWKLVSLWIGANDVGTLGYGFDPPTSMETYKAKIEEGLTYLKNHLPRTIVSIVGMFPAQLLQEARSILKTGNRAGNEDNQEKLDDFIKAYLNASFEIQDEGKFNTKEFAVVVQPFATEFDTVFQDKTGGLEDSFYAQDHFHLSKLGHAVIAKNYWQSLFEPVGKKTTKANLEDISPTIFALNEKNSFIKTVGNSVG